MAVFFHSAVAVWVFGDAQITGTKNFLFDSSEASSYVAEVSKILGNQAIHTLPVPNLRKKARFQTKKGYTTPQVYRGNSSE